MSKYVPKHIKEKFIHIEHMISDVIDPDQRIIHVPPLLRQWQKLEKKIGHQVEIEGVETHKWVRELYFEAKEHLNAM